MQRRDFIKTVAVASVGAMMSRRAQAEQSKAGLTLNLGSQESRLPGKDLREKVLRLEEWGGTGIEINHCNPGRVKEIKDAIAGTRVKVSALCWGSGNGELVSTDAEKRKKGLQSMEGALKLAGEIGSTGVIFVPCFHKQSTLTPDELDKVMLDFLPTMAETAKTAGTCILLEPLNKGETFYLNRLEQAARFCREINHPGLGMMGDFYHMAKEEKSDRAAFETAGQWLHHVHLASRTRVLPGQDDRSFVDGFVGLKHIGYSAYCSLECGIAKNTDAMVEIPKCFQLLQEQWKQAVA